jgi:hypothetical protein
MAKFLRGHGDSRAFTVVNMTARVVIFLLPTALLVGASLRTTGQQALMLWMGTAFQALVCILSFLSRRSWTQSIAPSIITLYLIALCWLWLGQPLGDWYVGVAKAVLLIVPLLAFAYHTLHSSGAPAIRRARLLAARLASRRDWPADLAEMRGLPEIKALRAALYLDASPALALLLNPRPEVRAAALLALEFRRDWRPGQAELVLQTAQRAEQPMVRAAGAYALAAIEDRELVEKVANFLFDPSPEVRKAAVEALLWETEHRWGWIRFAVRKTLGDPLFQHDGPLWHEGQQLTREALNDLSAWTAEKGTIAARAALTLGAYYHRALTERSDEQLVQVLLDQLRSRATAPVLRIEIGRVLQKHQELDDSILSQLLDPSNPTPLRMIAIEAVLAEMSEGPLHDTAVSALKDLARLPNREIALVSAAIIQRRLGVDLGLNLNQPLPALHSRQAAEITRKVMFWATKDDTDEELEDSRPVTRRA